MYSLVLDGDTGTNMNMTFVSGAEKNSNPVVQSMSVNWAGAPSQGTFDGAWLELS